MRFSKIAACLCAAALALNSFAARGLAAGGENVDAPVAAAPAPEPPAVGGEAAPARPAEAPAQSHDAAGPAPKKKGNAFVRVITAPFRGLARLFGGGKSSRKLPRQVARAEDKANPRPADSPAAAAATSAAQPAAGVERDDAEPSFVPAPAVLSAPQVTAPQPAAPQAVTHVKPAAPVADAPAPPATHAATPAGSRTFTPLIVGVASDSLTQGRALLEQGYLTEAIRELSIAAVSGSNLIEANNLLGLAYDRRGWHAQARECYERALAVAPNDARVLNNLGQSLYLDDRHKEALSRLRQAARLDPANQTISNNLALVYGRLRKFDDAYKSFLRAGGELYAHMQTATLLEAAGRDRDAIEHFESALRLDPASNEALRHLVTLYRRTGQPHKAEAAERALDPRSPLKRTSGES